MSRESYAPGDVLDLEFPGLKYEAPVRGEIVWSGVASDFEPDRYVNGLRFLGEGEYIHARLVVRLCHVESYRRAQEREHGRTLTSEQAVSEWTSRQPGISPN